MVQSDYMEKGPSSTRVCHVQRARNFILRHGNFVIYAQPQYNLACLLQNTSGQSVDRGTFFKTMCTFTNRGKKNKQIGIHDMLHLLDLKMEQFIDMCLKESLHQMVFSLPFSLQKPTSGRHYRNSRSLGISLAVQQLILHTSTFRECGFNLWSGN